MEYKDIKQDIERIKIGLYKTYSFFGYHGIVMEAISQQFGLDSNPPSDVEITLNEIILESKNTLEDLLDKDDKETIYNLYLHPDFMHPIMKKITPEYIKIIANEFYSGEINQTTAKTKLEETFKKYNEALAELKDKQN